jgi:hypothetical protein
MGRFCLKPSPHCLLLRVINSVIDVASRVGGFVANLAHGLSVISPLNLNAGFASTTIDGLSLMKQKGPWEAIGEGEGQWAS